RYALSVALPAFPTRRSSDLFRGHDVEGDAASPVLEVVAFHAVLLEHLPVLFGARVLGLRAAREQFERGADCAKAPPAWIHTSLRSEEHTSELQSRENLVCRL